MSNVFATVVFELDIVHTKKYDGIQGDTIWIKTWLALRYKEIM
jgi:hypothetical protein